MGTEMEVGNRKGISVVWETDLVSVFQSNSAILLTPGKLWDHSQERDQNELRTVNTRATKKC